MITLQSAGVRWQKGTPVPASVASPADREKTMAYQIFRRHNQREEAGQLHLKFDSLISHDITYVGIIQTAKASGLKEFPVPYVMTNCHNSLCAVGGTINEDDHVFGLSAAIKYGGNFVPRQPGGHPPVRPGDDVRLRADDPGVRQPHPLRRHRHHGGWARAARRSSSSC